jgi:selenoprotein W-related protein
MEELMDDANFRQKVQEITVLPKGDGIFNVTVNDELIFSKDQTDRFPHENEVSGLMKEKYAQLT